MTSFTLRPFKKEDLTALVKYANNKSIARNMTNRFPHPYTEDAGRQFIEFAMADNNSHIRVIEVNGELAGAVGIHLQDDVMAKNAELGYWLAEPYWGRGITTAAVGEMTKWAFKDFDVVRVFARPFGSNVASQRLLEKLSFQKEAHIKQNIFKWGEWEDEIIYGIRRPV